MLAEHPGLDSDNIKRGAADGDEEGCHAQNVFPAYMPD